MLDEFWSKNMVSRFMPSQLTLGFVVPHAVVGGDVDALAVPRIAVVRAVVVFGIPIFNNLDHILH